MKGGYLHLWYAALNAEFGVVLETDNPDLLRQYLYRARKSVEDPELMNISVAISPAEPNQVWLIKRYASEGK